MKERAAVLLVDDVPANLVSLKALLQDLDCDLVSVRSGNEALRALLKREFAVVLLDVQMPGMDGYEVAALARGHPASAKVPIVFLTAGHQSDQSLVRGYESGAIDFLFKPLNPVVLRSKVGVFLELYRHKREIANEVAAHRRTSDELRLSNEALRHFTAAASHDLKAPIRAIRGFLSHVLERGADDLGEETFSSIERSFRAAGRMDSLLVALSDYARLRTAPRWGQVDCNALLAQVVADLEPRRAETGGTIEVENLPTVEGDADRLYQLFQNLVGNALKFRHADHGPRVRVSSQQQNDDVRFCVEDQGIGIPRDKQASIFEAFQRLHASRTYEGSGLGLAICKQIVEQHGGRVSVESEPGEGARFFVTLPRYRPRPEKAAGGAA